MLDIPLLRSLDGRLCQLLHLNKPLVGDHRLDDRVASVALSDRDHLVLGLHQVAGFFQVLHPGLSALVAVHSGVFSGQLVHGGIVIDAAHHLEIMSLSDLEVVRVVGRSDLYGTCSLLRIRILVPDHRDLTADQRQDHLFPDEIRISLIVRSHGYRHVSEHCLRTGGSHYDALSPVSGRIPEVPVLSVFVLVLHLCVGQGRLAGRAPVDQPVSFVDQALVVKPDEELVDRLVAALIHGETLSAPVAGVTELAALLRDASAVFFFPVPGVLQELLSRELPLVLARFFLQLVGHLDLCGDAGVVAARYPQGAVAFHPLVPDENILQSLVEGMSHVELAGDVWRGHNDGERFLVFVYFRVERPGILPHLVDAVLEGFGIISFAQILHSISSPVKKIFFAEPQALYLTFSLRRHPAAGVFFFS